MDTTAPVSVLVTLSNGSRPTNEEAVAGGPSILGQLNNAVLPTTTPDNSIPAPTQLDG